ncbi:polyketide cyclase [Marmoricola endophyticus]|uniref:Polyketide cyclase n=1 Tax=Marmoricola endophyticus TaxID=2040280 RepID=A0A917F9M1_9ACTN|nr:SRPBCC family protein [Marmoricola endophyticus]GGF58015.1 polyketide cyclase [Marmoricola endophyticus]
MSPRPADLSASTRVEAPVDRVWEVVGDVRTMPDFSPELRKVFVLGRRSGPGARFVGINKRGLAVWPTTSKVVRWEPSRAIAWKVAESGATWMYELEPTDGGAATTLTARRILPAFSAGTTLLGPVIGGAEGHDRELGEGLATTLERMKARIEG